MASSLRIGTRGSPLALAQARLVAEALRTAHGWGGAAIEIVPITTSGDMIQDRPLAEVGGKALWTKELDRALGEGRIDLSVHSMKDVESVRPEALTLVATLPRADVRDRLIGALSVAALKQGARVGTSSPRRKAQLLRQRPDLEILAIRGNVATRLRRLSLGEADATLLAAAGLDRLGDHHTGTPIEVEEMLPAPAQGAIGVEVRAADARIRHLVRAVDHGPTSACVRAERAFLRALGGDCRSPVAALAEHEDGAIHLRVQILTPDGSESVEDEARFARSDGGAPAELARAVLSRASTALRAHFDG